MSLQDKSIQCFECGNTFVFTVAEQEEFQAKGHLHEPKRCNSCRQTRKERHAAAGFNGSPNMRSRTQMFAATCARCGKSAEVPFQPRQGRPVYCRECYSSLAPRR